MSKFSVVEARRSLLAAGVTGPHQSHSRESNVSKIQELLSGEGDASFGLSGVDEHSPDEILAFMAELTGCSPDIAELAEQDMIDPERTTSGILMGARRLSEAARAGARLLAATGHPTGVLEHHMRVVDAYAHAGGKVMRLREDEKLRVGTNGRGRVRYVGGVACLTYGAALEHTHSADAMEALLQFEQSPEIVLGDHGFAGAAIEAGIPTVAVMDINDHALAIAWAKKRDVVIVPMDDNRPPHSYEPSWRLFERVLLADRPETSRPF